MSHRLLVNPGTPAAWEIALKSGVNRIGRGEANDFQIPHGSVSGAHCEVVVTPEGVTLRDLGSTNGSFINRAPVREAVLQSGQHIQLGSVDMIFESAATAAPVATTPPLAVPIGAAQPLAPPPPPVVRINLGGPAAPTPAPAAAAPAASVAPVRIVLPVAAASSAPPAPPPPAAPQPGGLRFSGLHKAAPEPVAPVAAVEEVEAEPPLAPPVGNFAPSTGAEVCKFHAKIPARFYCGKCQKYYCDMCVATRTTSAGQSKTCRACGAHVTALQVRGTRPTTRSFYGTLPGAFVYPFRGFGSIILIFATMAFSALSFIGGIWIFVFYGFLFLFMQNIIHTTTSDENESLGFPDGGSLLGAAFQLAATIVASFGLAIGLIVAKLFDVDIPVVAIIAAGILGCLYFPMAFLAVAMKDSVLAANPLVVFPAILKMPAEYLVTSVLLIGVFGIRRLGDILSSVAGGVSLSTKDMSTLFISLGAQAGIAFFNVYLLTVTMRVLGLLYNTKKEKFGWFSH